MANLICAYDQALAGKEYTLEPRAMIIHEQNLRLPELNRLMSACGVSGVITWVEQHRAVKDFFASGDRLTGSAESEMAELVKYRNDAAHGSIDISDILNVNGLIEFCDFISAVCEALAERVQLAGLHSLKPQNFVKERGKVTESLKDGMVAIGSMTGAFKVGTSVYLCGETYCIERSIVSLQLEGVSHEEVNLFAATELGLMFDAPGKKNAILMIVEPPPVRAETEKDSSVVSVQSA